jgi:hypothetical protein
MALGALSRALGLTISKATLLMRSRTLTTMGATGTHTSLHATDGPDDADLRSTPFWTAKMSSLLHSLSDPQPSPQPPTLIYASDFTDPGSGTGMPLRAGFQLARHLRGRGYAVVHVFARLEPALPEAGGLRRGWLLKIVASLVVSMIHLLPAGGGCPANAALSEQRFEALAAGEYGSLNVGLSMLAALRDVRLDVGGDGARGLVVVVDGLDACEHDETARYVEMLNGLLASIADGNAAHLVFTMEQPCESVTGYWARRTA